MTMGLFQIADWFAKSKHYVLSIKSSTSRFIASHVYAFILAHDRIHNEERNSIGDTELHTLTHATTKLQMLMIKSC